MRDGDTWLVKRSPRPLGWALGLCVALAGGACVTSTEVDLDEAARINTQLGADYLRSGNIARAVDKLQKAVEQNPAYAPARATLALAYAARGDAEGAERTFKEALRLQPDNPQTMNNFGVFLCARGRREEAVGYFLRAAKTPGYDTPAAAYANAGGCLRGTHPEQAETYLREALRIRADYPDALSQLAWISATRKDFLRARGFLQRYEDSGARMTAEMLWIGARAEAALGDAQAARRYRERLLTEFPASSEAVELSRNHAS